MKKQLKKHIKLLQTCDSHSQLIFDDFLKSILKILDSYECKFRYLRSDSIKNGHIKATVNRSTGEYSLELAINRADNVGGQVYTIIHELTHLINNHIFGKELTKKQGEIVADTTALYFINKYDLVTEYKTSAVSNKWDVENYSNLYIDNMQISKRKYDEIIRQINDSKLIIERMLIEY